MRPAIQITPLGKSVLGDHFLWQGHSLYLAAFRKEIDEVTGIVASNFHSPGLDVQFTYRIIPILDLSRDARIGSLMLGNRRDREKVGTFHESNGKLESFVTSSTETFMKYDDGWRLESHFSDLRFYGGIPRQKFDQYLMY